MNKPATTTTPAQPTQAQDAPGEELERELDEALDESFPSSDPVAVNITRVTVPPAA